VSANKRNACTSSPCITTVTVSFEGIPEEGLNPILTQRSLAASHRRISPSLSTQFQRTNELAQRTPKAGRSAALTALHRLIKLSYALIDSIRFSFPSPALYIRGLGAVSDIKAYQDQSERGDATPSKLLVRSYRGIRIPLVCVICITFGIPC
jgi:hypothetical protein